MCVSVFVFFSIDRWTPRISSNAPPKNGQEFFAWHLWKIHEDPPIFLLTKKRISTPVPCCVVEFTTFFILPDSSLSGALALRNAHGKFRWGAAKPQFLVWKSLRGRYRVSPVLHAYIDLKMDGKDKKDLVNHSGGKNVYFQGRTVSFGEVQLVM